MADEEKNLSGKMADFLTKNGYHLDDQATAELKKQERMQATQDAKSNITASGSFKMEGGAVKRVDVDKKIYVNNSGDYVCAQTDNQTYVALNKVHEKEIPMKQWIIEGSAGHGGRSTDQQMRNWSADDVNKRLSAIAEGNNIPLAAVKGPEKARV